MLTSIVYSILYNNSKLHHALLSRGTKTSGVKREIAAHLNKERVCVCDCVHVCVCVYLFIYFCVCLYVEPYSCVCLLQGYHVRHFRTIHRLQPIICPCNTT